MLTGVWPRVIPVLLLSNGALIKTAQFKKPVYVGDPINAVKIFNDKEADELILLDIDASRSGKGPDFKSLLSICREAFMPLSYGGGIASVQEAKKVLKLGFEKIVINSAALGQVRIIREISEACGSQSVVVSIDVTAKPYYIYSHLKKKEIDMALLDYIKQAENSGAGEIMISSVDREGTFLGYDLELVKMVSSQVQVPVIACGGAGSVRDLERVISETDASAAAAGSMFVFYGKSRSVLISYPSHEELKGIASGK